MSVKIKKIIASVLCLSLITGSVGVLAYTSGKSDVAKGAENTSEVDNKKENKKSDKTDGEEISKEETVYVMTKADGSVKKIIVSDWIKNSQKAKTIEDYTNLENTENVKGNEKYTINSDNMRVWDADGNDIYYKGETDKELPVDIAVSYQLDGEDISVEDLAGKSGRVTMRFDYDNRQFEEAEINGVKTKIYVPFIMLTGTMLNNDIFSNVEISNGKVINDGDKTIVIGFAMPGMQENLNIDKNDLEIPNYLEITADVKDFELSTTLSVATNEFFNDVDVDKTSDVDKLIDSMGDLTNAMDQLIDGSSALYDGVSTLLDKSEDLISGVKQLSNGASRLKNGTKSVKNGSSQLYSGINDLYSGLGKLKSNNKDLTEGAKSVFNTLLTTANSQIKSSGIDVENLTISNYSTVLNKAISSLGEDKIRKTAEETAKAKVTQAVEEQRAYIETQVEVAVRQKVLEGVLAKLGYTYDQYKQAAEAGLIDAATQAQIDAAVEQMMNTSDIKNQISTTVESKIQSIIAEKLNSDEVKKQIDEALKQAKDGVESLKKLKSQLDSYNEFYTGITNYTNGVTDVYNGAYKLKNGAYQLKNGTSNLSNGAVKLYNGIATLKNGSGKLVDGVKQLKDGSMQLSDGIKELNEKGIKKLSDNVNGELSDTYERLKATVDVSKNYNSFAGISTSMPGITRFVYKSDSIEKNDK
ncbi:MAG: hypothetical protein ACI39F_08860 [Acutalibacteraceae bacterium]